MTINVRSSSCSAFTAPDFNPTSLSPSSLGFMSNRSQKNKVHLKWRKNALGCKPLVEHLLRPPIPWQSSPQACNFRTWQRSIQKKPASDGDAIREPLDSSGLQAGLSQGDCPDLVTTPVQVKARFPTMDSLVEAKLVLPHEAVRLEKVDFRYSCFLLLRLHFCMKVSSSLLREENKFKCENWRPATSTKSKQQWRST